MKTILIVDDVRADAIKMKNMILSQHNKEKYIFKYIDNLFNCIRFLHIHKVDLILLDLEFTEPALKLIAEKAKEKKIGARGLRSVLEEVLDDVGFDVQILSL